MFQPLFNVDSSIFSFGLNGGFEVWVAMIAYFLAIALPYIAVMLLVAIVVTKGFQKVFRKQFSRKQTILFVSLNFFIITLIVIAGWWFFTNSSYMKDRRTNEYIRQAQNTVLFLPTGLQYDETRFMVEEDRFQAVSIFYTHDKKVRVEQPQKYGSTVDELRSLSHMSCATLRPDLQYCFNPTWARFGRPKYNVEIGKQRLEIDFADALTQEERDQILLTMKPFRLSAIPNVKYYSNEMPRPQDIPTLHENDDNASPQLIQWPAE